MPYAKFLKKYEQYRVGQVVDLPGRLTWRLLTEGVVVRVEPPTLKKLASKIGGKKAK